MTPEERQRAGAAIAARIDEMHRTIRQVAEDAEVAPSTIRRLLRGEVWPHTGTRRRLALALDWPPGELARIASGGDGSRPLARFPTSDLVRELCRRYGTI